MRARLLPLFDRDVKPEQRIEAANKVLGASLGDREDAVAVMSLSDDPWLQSCAAFAIGEMRLTSFTPTLEKWTGAADPLLRATALDALDRLNQ